MEKYHFVRKINGTDETGIMDVESQKLICLCTEENSELLLKALRQPLVSGSLRCSEQEKAEIIKKGIKRLKAMGIKMGWKYGIPQYVYGFNDAVRWLSNDR